MFADFFPLHRSQAVMDKLNAMMLDVATMCDWDTFFELSYMA